MMDLKSIQTHFQNYLLATTGINNHHDIERTIITTTHLTTATRLRVYKNAYQARLLEALANNYPNLATYLGDENFQALSIAYIHDNPSNYRSIRWFGDKLAWYLTQYYNDYPYLAELAQFEWALGLSFDASDTPPVTLTQIAAIPTEHWNNMVLSLNPSHQCLQFCWNVVPIWQAIADKQPQPALVKQANPSSWLVWRNDYRNYFYALSSDEAWAITAIAKQLTFGELCAGLCQWHEEQDVGMQAAILLKNWIESGLITDLIY